MISGGDSYFLIQVMAIDKGTEKNEIPSGVTKLQDDYKDVFAEPKGLPPIRSQDHKIPLQQGSSPVNNHP